MDPRAENFHAMLFYGGIGLLAYSFAGLAGLGAVCAGTGLLLHNIHNV